MLSRLQSLKSQRPVGTVRGNYANRVQILQFLKHLLRICEYVGHVVRIRGLFGGVLIHIANRVQFRTGFLKSCGMVLKHASRSDYSDFLGHDLTLSSITWGLRET
jgi:hypothetical protein